MQKKNYYLESVLDLNASNVWGNGSPRAFGIVAKGY